MFITFEGGEGCGKTTHAKLLKDYLEGLGHCVVLTREPGGTERGQKIREILFDPKNSLDHFAEIFLFGADRAEHIERIILPALKERKVVISDRFTDSTVAYQIGGRGLPEDLVRYVNMISSKGLIPDLTFLLDVEIERGLQRAKKVSTSKSGEIDRFEQESFDFHKRVKAKYLEIARDNPERVKVLETSSEGKDEIQTKIRKIVKEALK